MYLPNWTSHWTLEIFPNHPCVPRGLIYGLPHSNKRSSIPSALANTLKVLGLGNLMNAYTYKINQDSERNEVSNRFNPRQKNFQSIWPRDIGMKLQELWLFTLRSAYTPSVYSSTGWRAAPSHSDLAIRSLLAKQDSRRLHYVASRMKCFLRLLVIEVECI